MKEMQFSKGDIIFKEGDMGDTLYQIEDGTVGIYSAYSTAEEQLLTELKGGKFFGEMAVIEAYPRSATAVALDDVKAVEIGSGEMTDFFKKDPEKIMDIMKSLGGRLRELTDDFEDVNSAIDDLRVNGIDKKSDSLVGRIKKFAGVYKRNKAAQKLSAETIRRLEQMGHADGFKTTVESYSKDTVIFKQGEKGNCMYDIHSGSVGIYKAFGTPDEKLLTTLMPNQFFGEMGMVGDDERTGTAVAMEDGTSLESIYPKDLAELFQQNPMKVEMILAHLSYRLRKLTHEYMRACEILFKVSEAEESGNAVGDDVKGAINGFKGSLYD